MKHWKAKEIQARRIIEDRGFIVHDANIIFGANCPNIDLVVYTRDGACYVQVKSSSNPAASDSIIIDGSSWTEEQLYQGAPIFNKHEHFKCSLVLLVDTPKHGITDFYLAPPRELENLVRPLALEFAAKPKKDGTVRSIGFRKELPRALFVKWRQAWNQLGDAPFPPSKSPSADTTLPPAWASSAA